MAKSLGGGFLKHGHDVMIGTRTPAKLADWAAKSPKGRTGGFSHAAEFGEIVVLAVKGTAASDALHAAGAVNLGGKCVIDTTNPIAGASSGGARLFLTLRPAVLGQQCLEGWSRRWRASSPCPC